MANLVELFDNIVQMQALNGVPLANGKLYVYALGRTRLMDTWSDVDGESLNTNPIILDDAGQAHVYVSDDFDYTLVVCDAYNNEIFSIDKYLYSKGEHSHADVAVAPSEHIAVSSYHVGETTVYVPYIQGELGKTYHGIEPIVVNNQENKISARNIALGVQEPLFFVEDSESACIIGASGLQPSGNYATVEWVTEHDYMQKEKLEFNEDGQVTGFDGSAFAAGYVDPSDFIPWSASSTFQSAGNYATTDDLTAYYPASNPNGFIDSDAISAMATTGFVADVSADITAMIPTALTGDYLTKDSADTLYQPIGNYATSADVTGTAQYALTTAGWSEVTGGGGSVTGEYELSAGNGISINNDPINQKTIISVSGDYATNSDLQTVSGEITAMIPTALTGEYLDKASADTLYYGIDNPSGFITGVDLTDYAKTEDLTAYQEKGDYYSASNPSGFITGVDLTPYQTTAEMTAYQPAGDYLTTGDSANFYTTANESGFITGVDLTPYQTVEGMTAYQEAGDYYSASNPSGFITGVDLTPYQTTAEMTGYMTTAERADFYTTANESGFITGIPDTYLQNTDLSTEDGKVTAISGIPLSAGGDVPEGVLVESGLEFNAVQEISGYNGSAIAQYGAEKQFLTHDDTIVHVSNSAQYAFGVNLSGISADLARMMGVDETVLFEGEITGPSTYSAISEPISSFETVKIYAKLNRSTPDAGQWFEFPTNKDYITILGGLTNATTSAGNAYYGIAMLSFTGNEIKYYNGRQQMIGSTTASTSMNAGIYKVIGIGRKS